MIDFESAKKDLLSKNEQVLTSYDSFMNDCLDFYCSKRGLENNADSQKILLEEFKNMEVEDFEKLSLICSTFMYVNDLTNKEARKACEHQFVLAKECQVAGKYSTGQFLRGNGLERYALYNNYENLLRAVLKLMSDIHRVSQPIEERIIGLSTFKKMSGSSLSDDDCSDFIDMMHLITNELSKVGLIAAGVMYVEDPNDKENEEGFNKLVASEKLKRVQDELANNKNIQFM